jgi:tetratricopeptide (TPR) repeat protein
MRRIHAVLLAGLLFGAAAAEADREAALAAFDRGDLDAARAALRADEGQTAFYLALASQGDERIAALARARALADGQGGWLEPALRAVAAADEERFADAAAAYREATAAAPNDARLWKFLGDALQRGENVAEARAAYERAVALAPAYAPALLELGQLRLDAGEFGQAFNAFNHAIDDQGRPVAGLVGKATASLYLGDRQGAVETLERAIQLAPPGMDRYRALMGIVYVRTLERRLPEGLDKAEQAVAMWTELGRADMAAAAANATGRVLLETGDPDGGERWYDRAAQIVAASSIPAAERTIWKVRELHGKARCAAARRERERADDLAIQALQLMDTDRANADHYAWIGPYLTGYLRYWGRDYAAALDSLLASDTKRPYIQFLIGDCYARRRSRDEARTWYQRALAGANGLDPESVIVRPLAEAWLEKNR